MKSIELRADVSRCWKLLAQQSLKGAAGGRPNRKTTKDEIADYLEAYAREFEFPVRTGIKVDKLCGSWLFPFALRAIQAGLGTGPGPIPWRGESRCTPAIPATGASCYSLARCDSTSSLTTATISSGSSNWTQ